MKRLERRRAELTDSLAEAGRDHQRLSAVGADLAAVEADLAAVEEEWLALSVEAER